MNYIVCYYAGIGRAYMESRNINDVDHIEVEGNLITFRGSDNSLRFAVSSDLIVTISHIDEII